MRDELRQLATQVDHLRVLDLAETIELCNALATSHWQDTHAPFADGDMASPEFIESLADQNFRTAGDVHYIWQLGLWRLHAIFEALIAQDVLQNRSVPGVRRKLHRLRELGFSLTEREESALSDWTTLRDALSHRPVFPVSVTQQVHRDDLEEVAMLYATLIERWRSEAASAGR